MQNKLCLNVRFATGLSPAASSHDLPHAKFIFKRACLETQPGQAMPARQRNLLRFILFYDFSYARFSFSFHLLFVCGKLAVQRRVAGGTWGLNLATFTFTHISLLYIFVDYIHLVAVTPHL